MEKFKIEKNEWGEPACGSCEKVLTHIIARVDDNILLPMVKDEIDYKQDVRGVIMYITCPHCGVPLENENSKL
jgi:hypothetical protein